MPRGAASSQAAARSTSRRSAAPGVVGEPDPEQEEDGPARAAIRRAIARAGVADLGPPDPAGHYAGHWIWMAGGLAQLRRTEAWTEARRRRTGIRLGQLVTEPRGES